MCKFLGYLEKHYFYVKTDVVKFGITFGKIWTTFIPMSGHTESKPKTRNFLDKESFEFLLLTVQMVKEPILNGEGFSVTTFGEI